MVAFLLSILASLALESPVVAIEKVIFGTNNNKDIDTQRTMAVEHDGDAQAYPSAPYLHC